MYNIVQKAQNCTKIRMEKELKEIIEVSNDVSESNVPLEELIFPIDVKWLNKQRIL